MPDFFNLLILMVVIWTTGKVFRFLKLPVVFGELMGGILVGPALLGWVPADSEIIKVIAELGIFFMMLHVGLETNPKNFFKSTKKSFLIALGGIFLTLLGGFFASRAFGLPILTSLFIGTALSATAIAISARLLKDCKIHNFGSAHLILSASIITDVFVLILFSVILNFAELGTVTPLSLVYFILKIVLFFGVVLYGGMKIAPFMNRVINFGNKSFTLTLIIALLMGLIAELIGLHMIIGAFLAGLFIREELINKKLFAKIEDRIYGLSYGFFAPIFFASLAFNLDFKAFQAMPKFLLVILLVAIFGKVIGSGLMCRLQKIKPIKSLAIGLAMNNRGTIDLIIASIGLQMGIINSTIFSILVATAFIATMFSILGMRPVAKKLRYYKKSVKR